MSNEDLTPEELNRVTDALNALSQHKNQPTQKEWGNIMEEANKAKALSSKRIKLLSAAASILVVAAIATTVVLTSGSDKKENNTADKTKKETATTKPLSEEERLLKNTYYVGYEGSYTAYDSMTNQSLGKTSEYAATQEGSNIYTTINDIAVAGRNLECNNQEIAKAKKTTPDKSKSFNVSYSCLGNKVEIELSGKKSSVKQANLGPVDQGDGTKLDLIRSLKDVYWISNTEFIGEVWDTFYDNNGSPVSDGESSYLIYTASNNIDLTKGKSIKDFNPFCCADTERHIMDVLIDGTKTYVLVSQRFETGQGDNIESKEKYFVIELGTGNTVWNIDLSDHVNGEFRATSFGSTYTDIYGSFYPKDDETEYGYGFAYSDTSDTFVDKVNGERQTLILPKK